MDVAPTSRRGRRIAFPRMIHPIPLVAEGTIRPEIAPAANPMQKFPKRNRGLKR
jgi:hypothetical protein